MHNIQCTIFFFPQNPAYEMRIRDLSSDVCSSDLLPSAPPLRAPHAYGHTSPASSPSQVHHLFSAILLEKSWRGPLSRVLVEQFWELVQQRSEERRVGKE